MPELVKRPFNRWIVWLAALAAAAAFGMLAAKLLWPGIKPLGDEPPIRVKNGSMDFELPASQAWKAPKPCSTGDPKPCWTPDTGEGDGVFSVIVVSATACAVPADATIDRITVTYDGTKKVTIKQVPTKAAGTLRIKTRLMPHGLLAGDPGAPRLLRHDAGGSGYVTALEFDGEDAQGSPGRWPCSFADKNDLKVACIWSNAKGGTCTP